ncbi:MAG: hypothetical protein ACERKO_08070 [Acetanaerobacterium sp.]
MAAANRKKASFKVALGGIVTALALMLLFATGLVPIATYALPALAGALLICIVAELGEKWAFSVYAATAILSLLITPDREAALLFLFFFGHYPVIKSMLERIKSRVIEWLLKFIVFNACVLTCYALIFYVFQMQYVMESFEEFGRYSVPIFLITGNLAFLLYDFTLSSLVAFYMKWVRVKLFKRL